MRPHFRFPLRLITAGWRVGLLAVAAALIWVAHFDRWTGESWQVPTDYSGDAPESLARLKAASEGDTWPLQPQVIRRLGAPYGAHWNAYPAPDKPLMLLLGAFVPALGLYATANLGLLLAQVTAVLAFYLVARWLRFRWEWAAAGALLFGYTYHTFHRGLAHFSLVFTWTIPIGLATVWLVARSHRLAWRRPAAAACVTAGIVLGVSNPYNLFFWLQLMAWACVWQWFGPRRKPNLAVGLVTMATAVAAFLLTNAETWWHVENPDALPLLARNYGGTEVYALKPVEMFIPPPFHHWSWLAFFGERYSRWSPWRGEVFLPYLGLAGIVGFVWLTGLALRRLIERKPVPGHALTVTWIIAYAGIGGVTNLLALFAGFQVFRATNRAAIFVSAVVLFFLVGRLSRLSARWPGWLRLGVAAALAAFGVFEQLPKPENPGELATLAAEVKSDEAFGAALEKALPADAMIFQLPVLGFPEVQAPNQLGEYEHFRPYLVTQNLRFSYGAPKTRARGRWQRELESLPSAELVHQLERDGFAALYLNRKGFADRGEKTLQELARLGYTRRIEPPKGDQVVVILRPSPDPEPPLARSFTYGTGWQSVASDGWRWAYADGSLAYFNPYPHPVTADLRLNTIGVSPRELVLERDGEPIGRFAVDRTPRPLTLSHVELAPGVNHFKLRSREGPVRQGSGRNQLRSFGIEESSVRLTVKHIEPGKPTFAGLGRF